MAALGRQVFDWHRLVPLTWAHVARQTHRGEQKRTCPCLLYKLTTASNGGGLEKLSHVESRTYVQEPACRMRFTQYSLEKRRTPVAPGFVEREKVISSLLDMGFSDVHINGLLHLWPSTHTQQLLDIISELILLGLNPEPVYMALKQSPQLLKLPILHMKKRSGYLRKLGLGEGKLKTVLLCCPEIFTMHQRDIDSIVGVLKEKCLFTVQQVTKILHRCPYVLREDPGELEYKFQASLKTAPHTSSCLLVACVTPWRRALEAHPWPTDFSLPVRCTVSLFTALQQVSEASLAGEPEWVEAVKSEPSLWGHSSIYFNPQPVSMTDVHRERESSTSRRSRRQREKQTPMEQGA
ncbi:transcription termination factor 4, mitochondrial isoform X1 [Mustela lutreola]|uniref:transcription termination factor 4, mitochondrial isoform X1 n=1 Tax=Mustela lutreola TaxID=9666 RepID=UPI0027976813|nr:transcription termination factor 4, mitochondrial isoform X1 [Mustela lutreola]